jgi:hypothetical protein
MLQQDRKSTHEEDSIFRHETYIDGYYQTHASDTRTAVSHANGPCPVRPGQWLEPTAERHRVPGQGTHAKYSHVPKV